MCKRSLEFLYAILCFLMDRGLFVITLDNLEEKVSLGEYISQSFFFCFFLILALC